MLSHYKDEYILDQLIKDANTLDNPLVIEDDYVNDPSIIANLIINNPSRLFEAERQLMKEGKHDPAQFISNIRYKCMDSLGMVDNSDKEKAKRAFEEAEKKMSESDSK